MKSFKQYLEESPLHTLAQKHDNPISFIAAAIKEIKDKKLKLKPRGVANIRELGSWFVRQKKREEDKQKEKQTSEEKAPSALPPTAPNSYEY